MARGPQPPERHRPTSSTDPVRPSPSTTEDRRPIGASRISCPQASMGLRRLHSVKKYGPKLWPAVARTAGSSGNRRTQQFHAPADQVRWDLLRGHGVVRAADAVEVTAHTQGPPARDTWSIRTTAYTVGRINEAVAPCRSVAATPTEAVSFGRDVLSPASVLRSPSISGARDECDFAGGGRSGLDERVNQYAALIVGLSAARSWTRRLGHRRLTRGWVSNVEREGVR